MPQTRDTALGEPAANGPAPPVTETRVDAAHSIGAAASPSAPLLADLSLAEMPLAGLADIPLADIAVEQAISELARVEGGVQLRTQADQLAAHLRERQRDLEHRESQVNARIAAFEQEIRDARAWLAQRNDELNERESHIEARETPLRTQDVPIASPAASASDLFRAGAAAARSPAASSPTESGDGSRSGGDKPKVTNPTAGVLPKASPAFAEQSLSSEGPLSSDRPPASDRPVPSDGSAAFDEAVLFDRPLGEAEWDERKRALSRISQQIDRRRQALEELHEEIAQMHHEALELHLVTQESQAQLRSSFGAEAAAEALQAARERMARRYRKDAADLMRQRKELEWLKSDLAREHAKLERRFQELRGWIESRRASQAAEAAGDRSRGQPINSRQF